MCSSHGSAQPKYFLSSTDLGGEDVQVSLAPSVNSLILTGLSLLTLCFYLQEPGLNTGTLSLNLQYVTV